MKNEPKAVGRFVKNDVWSASVSRGSHEIYKQDMERTKSWQPDGFRINAERIRAGELVADHWLFGRQAAGMIVMGYISESELEPHRQALLAEHARHRDYWVETKENDSKDAKTIRFNPYEDIKAELYAKHEAAMANARKRND